jgi:hypothetical protein
MWAPHFVVISLLKEPGHPARCRHEDELATSSFARPEFPGIKRFPDAGGCIIKMCLIHSPIGAFWKYVNDSQGWHGTREHKGFICRAARECRFLNTLLSVPYADCYCFPCIAIP